MAKKKKKKSKKKVIKQLKIHQKGEYIERVKHVFRCVYSDDILDFLDITALKLFHLLRYPALKIIYHKDSKIPKDVKNFTEKALKEILSTVSSKIHTTDKEISIRDYFSIAVHLPSFSKKMVKEFSFDFTEFLMESVDILRAETSSGFYAKIYFIMDYHLGYVNDFGGDLYWYELDSYHNEKNKKDKEDKEDKEDDPDRVKSKKELQWESIKEFKENSMESTIILKKTSPKQINVIINDVSRPVKQFGITSASEGLIWFTIKSGFVGGSSAFSEIPLEVYTQSHAIDRFIERINTEDFMWIRIGLQESFDKPKVIKDEYSNYYLEYRIRNLKVGYFLLDIIDGIIIIRTFLFLTNNGTPEGKELQKLIGIQKLDKEFLNIDKLSTFSKNDFSKNKEIKNILIDSGCKSLLEIYNELMQDENDKNNDIVKKMHRYIQS